MKRIIFLLALAISISAAAQQTYPPTGSPNGFNRFLGMLQVDSAQLIPIRDTIGFNSRMGNITIRPNDGLYIRPGQHWQKVAAMIVGNNGAITWGDTLSGRPIATRKNLADSVQNLRNAISLRELITHRIPSLLGYPVNDTTYPTTRAVTEYLQQEVFPLTYYAFDRTIDSFDVYGNTTKYIRLYRHNLASLVDSFQDNNTVFTNGWGLLLTGTEFRIDTSLVPTVSDLDSVAALTTYLGVFPVIVDSVTHEIALAPSGVLPGTYTKVTVDNKGLVTAGTFLGAADIPVIPQSTVAGLPDTIANHNYRLQVNRQAIIDSTTNLRIYTNEQLALKENIANRVLSLQGYSANDTTYPTTRALTEYIQLDVHPYMYYAYDRTIDSIDVYGNVTKYIKLYRHSLPPLLDSFPDNNTTYTPGWGLLLSGNQFLVDSVLVATQHDIDSLAQYATYIGVWPVVVDPVTHQISLAASGVVPSTYTKVTVNDKGIVTAGAALSPGDIPNIDQSQVTGLVDTIAAHSDRIAVNRQAIIDTAVQIRSYTSSQLALKEDKANRLLSMMGATTTDTTYPTTNALAEYVQLSVYPFMYYAYDRAIDSMRVTGDSVKHITLYRHALPPLVDSFVDNNTVFDSTGIYSILAQKIDKADSLTGYATQYDISLKQDIANITDDALTSPNSTEYPSTKALSDAIDTALANVAGNYVPLSDVGQPNGVAPLDAGGKVDFAYLPASLMIYKGVWNPITNTPTLVNGTGTAGWVYKTSWIGGADSAVINLGAGNITFYRGDFVLYNGTVWERSVGTDNVVSVNGKQGVVLLRIQDIPGLQDSITAKEPVFAKGNLVAGTNVTLGGTLVGRLVGSGNVTINSAVPAGYIQFSDTLTTIATKKNLRDTAASIRSSLSSYELLANKVSNFNSVNTTLYPSTQAVANKFANGTNIAGQLKFLNNPDQFDMSPANMDWIWHDQFAFGRNLVLWETTTDFGANWTTGTANLGIFNQKQSDAPSAVLLTNTSGSLNGLRIRWSGFGFGQLNWIITQLNFTGTTCSYNMLVEESSDNVNFTTLATYTGLQQAGATTAAWRTPQATAFYTRITFTINNGLSPAGATATLKNLRGMALRAGDQGGGKEFEYPYTWTNEKYMRFTTPTYTPATGSTPLPAQYKIALLDTTAGKQLYSASLSAVVQGLSLSPTGAAGGDLSGNYPNPTVARLNGQLPAYYLSRANHTGTQAQSTINNLQDSLDSRLKINNGANFSNWNGNTWTVYGLDNIGVGVTTSAAGMSFYLKTAVNGFAKFKTDSLTVDVNLQMPKISGQLALTSQLTGGTVTSVGMTVPTGLTISGSPITNSGTLAVGLQSGYSIPTVADQANWTAAYNDKINSAAFTGTSTKTLTLTQQDGGTVTANFTDADTPYTAGSNISIAGHVITGTGAPASGSANYIWNNFAIPQTANAYINGNYKGAGFYDLSNNFLTAGTGYWGLYRNDGDPFTLKLGNLIVTSDFSTNPLPGLGINYGMFCEEQAIFPAGVKIGATASPAQALDVTGTIRQTGVASQMVKANASGDLVAAVKGVDYPAATGGAGYIQNQYDSAQAASAWITGPIKGNRFVGPSNNLLWPQSDHWRVSANDGSPGALKSGGLSVSDDWDEPPSEYGLFVKEASEFGGDVTVGTLFPGSKLTVVGGLKQSAVTSSMLKANASGDLVAAVASTDYLAPSAIAITGVAVGDGSILSGLASSTAKQLFRRNPFNTGYEWWTPDFMSLNNNGQTMIGNAELLRFNDLDEFLVDDANKINLSTDEDPITLNGAGGTILQPSAGNVGIGTSSPAAKLHVAGTIRQTAVTSSVLKANASGDIIAAVVGTDYAAASGSGSYIQNQLSSAQSAQFWINQDSRIMGAGNQVYTLTLGTSASGYNNGGRVQFWGAGGAEVSSIVGTYGNGTWNGGDAGRIAFNTYQSGSIASGMTLNGNNLDVFGNITARGGGLMIARFLTDQAGRRNWGFSTEGTSVGDFNLSVSNANNSLPSIPVLTALSDGKIGIATTSPSHTLTVNGDIAMGNSSQSIYTSKIGSYSGNLTINTGGGGNNLLIENGNVGINQATPTERLHVGGNAKIDGNITANNLSSGSYTPTITFADGSYTPEGFRYIRVGNIVNVDGRIAITPGTALIGTISLPVPSNIIDVYDVTGGAWGTGINAAGNIIRGDGSGDAALLSFNPSSPGSLTLYVHFSYVIQ